MKLTKEVAEKIFSAKGYEEAVHIAAELGLALTEDETAALKQHFTHELPDDELDAVAGGYDQYSELLPSGDYQTYEWSGGDEDQKYLCPNCNRPVHKGTLGLFYCDPCNEWWVREGKLPPNLANWSKKGFILRRYTVE